ncbi:hypothetical protein LDG_7221 [Legionella drancourtii LLAP12]|uniref:Uncharacterized protein n=1 Tax=Legionella drancourtii LLAP12 TaxID=658187 RepID=G9EPL9_9GAMM|nr:hypothetical protein LDG_7221 [Legionella drancourtii LLAP12]
MNLRRLPSKRSRCLFNDLFVALRVQISALTIRHHHQFRTIPAVVANK